VVFADCKPDSLMQHSPNPYHARNGAIRSLIAPLFLRGARFPWTIH